VKNKVHYNEISKLSVEEQLEFYKEKFELIGCDRCTNKLHWGWVLYEDIPYCEDCFDIKYEEDVKQAKKTVRGFEELIEKTKENYPEVNWEEEDETYAVERKLRERQN